MKKSQVLHYSLEEKLAIVPKSELHLEASIVIKRSKENEINFKTVLFYSSLGWQQTWAFRKAPEKKKNRTFFQRTSPVDTDCGFFLVFLLRALLCSILPVFCVIGKILLILY